MEIPQSTDEVMTDTFENKVEKMPDLTIYGELPADLLSYILSQRKELINVSLLINKSIRKVSLIYFYEEKYEYAISMRELKIEVDAQNIEQKNRIILRYPEYYVDEDEYEKERTHIFTCTDVII